MELASEDLLRASFIGALEVIREWWISSELLASREFEGRGVLAAAGVKPQWYKINFPGLTVVYFRFRVIQSNRLNGQIGATTSAAPIPWPAPS